MPELTVFVLTVALELVTDPLVEGLPSPLFLLPLPKPLLCGSSITRFRAALGTFLSPALSSFDLAWAFDFLAFPLPDSGLLRPLAGAYRLLKCLQGFERDMEQARTEDISRMAAYVRQ